MTTDPKQFFAYTPMDLAVLEDQSREQLYIARKTRWKYRRELQAALRDHERESKPSVPQPQSLNSEQATAAVCAGVVLAASALAGFCALLWVIQRIFGG